MFVLHSLWTLGSYIVPFIFVMSLVVFFHELGHFLIGRWCGVKVDAFSMGFGPELAHYTDRRGTRWRLAALPLGGYVKFHGEMPESDEADAKPALSPAEEEASGSFAAQKVWKRAAVVAAGPVANFILALAIFTGLFYIQGREILSPRVDSVVEGGRAAAAGFKKGDMVLAIDGQKIGGFQEMQRIVSASGDVTLHFTINRSGQQLQIDATPERKDIKTPFGVDRVGMLGVTAGGAAEDWKLQTFSLPGAAVAAAQETWYVVARTGSYLGGLAVGRESPAQLSGPVRITEVSGEVAKSGFGPLLNLAAILSISIGLLNLLPIPLLDGGHLLFYGFEAVRGRALPPRAQEFGFKIGLAFVASLMLVATYNDLARLTRQWLNLG